MNLASAVVGFSITAIGLAAVLAMRDKQITSAKSDSEPAANARSIDLPNQFCPVCGKQLESWRCKMICSRCGYFMSCSEFE